MVLVTMVCSIRNGSGVVYTAAVDLDANGQVDLLTLSEGRRGGREEESCYTLGVHWLRAEDGLPVVGRWRILSVHVC